MLADLRFHLSPFLVSFPFFLCFGGTGTNWSVGLLALC